MLGIIGGSGLTQLPTLNIFRREIIRTPYGEPSGALVFGEWNNCEIVFLPRHGYGHSIAPHKINYRANVWALKQAEPDCILAVAAVGSIREEWSPGTLVVPDQIIDYTWGRHTTFFDGEGLPLHHVDFTHPFQPDLRLKILQAAEAINEPVIDGGVYAATQGPRLETAAEIIKYRRDGADLVGMTAMPEAALARELELSYAAINVVSNHAAGIGQSSHCVSLEEIEEDLEQTMLRVRKIIGQICLDMNEC